jgi:REP element-mobilizing transposase RayT
VAEVVQRIKGGTARRNREEFPDCRGETAFGPGYFAESVEATDERIIEKYIRDQKTSKSEQTRIPGL